MFKINKFSDDNYIVLKKHFETYPEMEICDAIKLIYQSEFGGGHKVYSEYKCMKLIEELGSDLSTEQLLMPYFENIGGGYSRMNMSVLGAIPVELLGRMFMASISDEFTSNQGKGFEEKISALKVLCHEGYTKFGIDSLNKYLEEYRSKGENYHPVSHSEKYVRTYDPAYRVVRSDFCKYLDVFIRISRMYADGVEVTVGIDGPSYSGKTKLAKLISLVFDCNIFDTRDFTLPEGELSRQRGALCYVDLNRLRDEVLENLNTGMPFSYGLYDPNKDRLGKRKAIVPKRLNIIKGAYALHPKFHKYYELKVFLDNDPTLQTKGIITQPRSARSIRNESFLGDYFDRNNIRLNCDLYYEKKQLKESVLL